MFEHLDDPHPPPSTPRSGAGSCAGAQRRRRRRTAGGVGASSRPRWRATGGLYARRPLAGPRHRAGRGRRAPTGPRRPAGHGARPRHRRADGGRGPQTSTRYHARPARPRRRHAPSLLSFPRDLMVDLPGGGPAMINRRATRARSWRWSSSRSASPSTTWPWSASRGSRRWSTTWAASTCGSTAPLRDTARACSSTSPGCVTLDGGQALALVRSRKLEVLARRRHRGGATRSPTSGSVERSAQVLVAALAGLGAGGRGAGRPQDDVMGRRPRHGRRRAVGSPTWSTWPGRSCGSVPSDVSGATLPVVVYPPDPNRLALDATAAPAAIAAFVAGEPLPPTPPVTAGAPGVAGTGDPFSTAVGTC